MTALVITRNTETLTAFTALVANKPHGEFTAAERAEFVAARAALLAEKAALPDMVQSNARAAAMGRAVAKAMARADERDMAAGGPFPL